ncbi:MAG: class I SAM-dependent methyltransferase [Proteobacteria bacterium]|nr:class I SAM-dependent methyltransferase [Pseudomonadota bacterium]
MELDHRTIYREYAKQYDRLVRAEDCEHHLLAGIRDVCPIARRTVLEVGTGTGRITELLVGGGARVIGFDRELAMLEVARQRLDWRGFGRPGQDVDGVSTALACADARALPVANGWADLAIAGWVFGHFTMWLPADWKSAVGAALGEMERALAPGGHMIVIETLGTGLREPRPPSDGLADYYCWLEDEHGFHRRWLRTDYLFASSDEAQELCGLFFGSGLTEKIRHEKLIRVPECTGLWWRRIPGL